MVTYAFKAQNFLQTYCSKRIFWKSNMVSPSTTPPILPFPLIVYSPLGGVDIINGRN